MLPFARALGLAVVGLIAACAPRAHEGLARVESGPTGTLPRCPENAVITALRDSPPKHAEQERVDTVIADNRWRLKACFDRAVDENPKAAGVVKVRVDLDAEGGAHPEVYCTTAPDELSLCVAHAFEAMHFWAPKGGSARFMTPVLFEVEKKLELR
ncbi:MAG: hypothetical protein ACXVEF_41520 [Polyangiales bacterium]